MMKGRDIIKAGIGGTYWMTLYTNIASRLANEELGVVKILGSLLTKKNQKRNYPNPCLQTIAGTLIHYGIGILFSYGYHLLWKNHLSRPRLHNGALLGLLNGLIGIAGWKPFITLHPNPPKINYKKYLSNLLIAHIVFGTATTYYYIELTKHQE